ncbi:hypothetical protein CRUP_037627 [Coryphaenoides rupestris]|nr:hypothetical protein CRUP_037627 [Coryphaenoides rupestris]
MSSQVSPYFGSQGTTAPVKEEDEEEEEEEEDDYDEEDPYTLVGTNDEEYDSFSTTTAAGSIAAAVPVAHRPPVPTPRPDATTTTSRPMDGPVTFIAQVVRGTVAAKPRAPPSATNLGPERRAGAKSSRRTTETRNALFFQKKISKGHCDVLNIPPVGQGRRASLASTTYDTFVPGAGGGAGATTLGRLDDTALSELPAREKLNQLRASVVNSRQDGNTGGGGGDDDNVYASGCRRERQEAESDFGKPRKGQHVSHLYFTRSRIALQTTLPCLQQPWEHNNDDDDFEGGGRPGELKIRVASDGSWERAAGPAFLLSHALCE